MAVVWCRGCHGEIFDRTFESFEAPAASSEKTSNRLMVRAEATTARTIAINTESNPSHIQNESESEQMKYLNR